MLTRAGATLAKVAEVGQLGLAGRLLWDGLKGTGKLIGRTGVGAVKEVGNAAGWALNPMNYLRRPPEFLRVNAPWYAGGPVTSRILEQVQWQPIRLGLGVGRFAGRLGMGAVDTAGRAASNIISRAAAHPGAAFNLAMTGMAGYNGYNDVQEATRGLRALDSYRDNNG